MNIPMVKKYRLGNQPEEYELVTAYLGWLPSGYASWKEWDMSFLWEKKPPKEITLHSPDKKEEVSLFLIQALSKDAFPLEFFSEERAKNWWHFYKVATKENPAVEFVIPLH